jgi:LPXTG-motif cell wall-anchored protein
VAAITITAGQLPVTGADSKTIAVIGSGAVLLGGLLLLAVRRLGRRRE